MYITFVIYYHSPSLIRLLPPKATPSIRLDFRCFEIVNTSKLSPWRREATPLIRPLGHCRRGGLIRGRLATTKLSCILHTVNHVLVFVDDGMISTTLTCGLWLVKDKKLYRIEHVLSQSQVSISPVSCILQSTSNNSFHG